MSSIQSLDFWTNVTLHVIWKEQVHESIQNSLLNNSPTRSSTPPPTRAAFNQQALCLAPKRKSKFFDDDNWDFVEKTPFTEPFWGTVVNK